MRYRSSVWITAVVLVAAALTVAVWTNSPVGAQGGPKGPGMPPGGPFGDLNEKDIKELVQTVMLVRLTKELDLDTDRTVVLVRQFEEAKEKSAELAQERRQTMEELHEAVKSEAPDEEIKKKLDALIAADKKMQQIKLDAFKEASKDLSPTQSAKLYVFIHQFEDQMRKLVTRARMRAGMPGMMPPEGRGPGMAGMAPPEGRGPGMPGMMPPEGRGPGMRGTMWPGRWDRDDARPPEDGARGFGGGAGRRREGRGTMRGMMRGGDGEADPPAKPEDQPAAEE